MKITKLNFKYIYPEISKTLSECNLISLDFEFSGTSLRKELVNTKFDEPNLRYFKIKENIKKFMPLQVGLCGLKLNSLPENKTKASLYPMNFYIFPHSESDSMESKKYYFDTGSINFLTSNAFDFNKTFYDGIRYLSLSDYEKMKRNKTIKKLIKQKKEEKVFPPEARAVLVSYYPTLEKFVQKFIENHKMDLDHPDNIIEFEITYLRRVFLDYLLSNVNNLFKYEDKNIIFDIEVVEQSVLKTVLKLKITDEKRLQEKAKVMIEEKESKKFSSWVYYQSLAMCETEDEVVNKLWRKILMNFNRENEAGGENSNTPPMSVMAKSILALDQPEELFKIGFTKIITDLIKFEKPLIFHNGLLDLIHLVDKFIEPVPDTFDDFKKIVNKYFPKIYDTKFMIENNTSLMNIFQDSSLEEVSKKLIKDKKYFEGVDLEIDEKYKDSGYELDGLNVSNEFNRNEGNINISKNISLKMKSHEAGYDAMVTSITFLFIFKHLFKNLSFISQSSKIKGVNYFDKCLEIFKNKMLFSGLQFSCDLEPKETAHEERRYDIFIITDLPEIITQEEIKENLKIYFNVSPRVYKLFGVNIGYIIFTVNSEKEEFLKKVAEGGLIDKGSEESTNENMYENNKPLATLPLQNYSRTGVIFNYSKYLDIIKVDWNDKIDMLDSDKQEDKEKSE